MKTKHMIAAFLTLIFSSSFASASDINSDIEEFYSNNDIEMVIRATPGGGYDMYSRLLARHMGRHIPGNPNIIPINMPGGAGLTAANYMANQAPQDGTVLSIISLSLPMYQALDLVDNLRADMRELLWVGNMVDSPSVIVSWHTSAVRTLDDAIKQPLAIGATAAGSISVQLPNFLNNTLGTQFEIIRGYSGGNEINLAMEQGEVDGRSSNPWSSYLSTQPRWVEERMINPLIQVGIRKGDEIPDVPLLMELATTEEQQQMFDFVSNAMATERPLATTPNVPPERLEVLRTAFERTLTDPEFLEDAARQQAEINLMTGQELEDLIMRLFETPEELRNRIAEYFEG